VPTQPVADAGYYMLNDENINDTRVFVECKPREVRAAPLPSVPS
jgi:hypothetical protein